MPFDSTELPTSELRTLACCLDTFDGIRDQVDELFQALGAIESLVQTQLDLLEATDREGELVYAQARGYIAMRAHVATVNALDRRLGEAMKDLLGHCPTVRRAKAALKEGDVGREPR